jgi:hypothetical protein
MDSPNACAAALPVGRNRRSQCGRLSPGIGPRGARTGVCDGGQREQPSCHQGAVIGRDRRGRLHFQALSDRVIAPALVRANEDALDDCAKVSQRWHSVSRYVTVDRWRSRRDRRSAARGRSAVEWGCGRIPATRWPGNRARTSRARRTAGRGSTASRRSTASRCSLACASRRPRADARGSAAESGTACAPRGYGCAADSSAQNAVSSVSRR